MKKIGFIGLGIMGFAMAEQLIKAGYELYVYNRTADKAKPLAGQGAQVCASPAEVARHSEAVIVMVKADADVEEVVLGESGIMQGANAGLIILNGSTILPSTNVKLAKIAAAAGVHMLDCPVTGSGTEAKVAKLNFLVGGDKELFERCRPLFAAMGKSAYHMGCVGTGSYMKLANNALFVGNLLALCESLAIAAKSGIDPEYFLEIISQGGARSAVAESRIPKILSRDFSAAFTLAFLYKDLGLISQLTSELGVATPVLAVVKEMVHAALLKGHGQDDVSGVIKVYEETAGIEIKK